MSETLLVELITEELPPKALRRLGEAFATTLQMQLAQADLLEASSTLTWYATPRRLAARISLVRDQSPDKAFDEKLVPAKVGFDKDGKPTPALIKRLSSLGRDESAVPSIASRNDGKIDMLFLPSVAAGQSIRDGLQAALEQTVDRLPIPKVMTYQIEGGLESVKFVRPAHGLVALWGNEVLPVKLLGLVADRVTHGHRFLGDKDIRLDHADDYESALLNKGKVIAGFDARRSQIEQRLKRKADELDCALKHDDALLDEVTALVEWPVVYAADFDREFLDIPQECLILTMRTNQKYFPLFDRQGKLTARFLLVSNMQVADPSNIINGNRRVVRPRLADARFFYDTDRKAKLETLIPKLGNVVYHNRLGTQLERVQRIRKLAGSIAQRLGSDVESAERAAWLCKADLMSEMVGEFPELQGVMGRYYALHDGESATVADAIEQHYRPRFANDTVPEDNVAASVALADKIDTLIGIFGIGLVTGLMFTELFGVASGGLIVPGYMAVFVTKPWDILLTLGVALATFAIVRGLSSALIVYGRRRTALMILVGYILGLVIRRFTGLLAQDFAVIGFIIPGLIAIWMDRQGTVQTLASLVIVTVVVRMALVLVMGADILS